MKLSSLTAVAFVIVILACGKALAQTPADPCQSSAVAKKSVVIVTPKSGATTQLIPASPHTIHVCGFLVDGAVSFAFAYGSGIACSVNMTALTAEFQTVNAPHAYSGPGTIFSVPANKALCVFVAGQGSPVTGVLTYTQP